MAAALAHRGPDGAASWCTGPVGLAQLWLNTSSEVFERGALFQDPTSQLTVTADARLDNREELRQQLGLLDQPAATLGDHALILAAYRRWGEDCPRRLLGDFAFAIWDEQRQQLFCARDHFGVKPFFYYVSPQLFAFASEIKALFALEVVPRRVNDLRVGEYLVEAEGEPASTFFAGVLRLLPGHALTADYHGVHLQRYWSLDPGRELHLGSDAAYAEALRERFLEAVRCRLRGTKPVGAMLSGGIDSSSVTCAARQSLADAHQPPLHTFSAKFDSVAASDEQRYQRAVLAQNGVIAHAVEADRLSPLGDLERLLHHCDQALDSGNLYVNWNLYRVAQQHHVRVILDGFDGDTTLSHGIGYLSELAHAGRWLALAREVRALAPNLGERWQAALGSWIWRLGLLPTLDRLALTAPLDRLAGAIRTARTRKAATASTLDQAWRQLVRADFVARFDLEARRRGGRTSLRTEREHHYCRLSSPHMARILEALDAAASAFSIELRFPFWDRRLVEFCLALPPEQKLSQGWSRLVMRRAMEGILPLEIQWRPGKSSLHPAFEQGLRTLARAHLDEILDREVATLADYVECTRLRELYRRFRDGFPLGEDEVNTMWRAASVGLWLRGSAPAPQMLKEGGTACAV
jgi:asparagine synthase (glutamine-hydrolysing)